MGMQMSRKYGTVLKKIYIVIEQEIGFIKVPIQKKDNLLILVILLAIKFVKLITIKQKINK